MTSSVRNRGVAVVIACRDLRFPLYDVNMTSWFNARKRTTYCILRICETTPSTNAAVVFSFVLPEASCQLVKAGISGGEG